MYLVYCQNFELLSKKKFGLYNHLRKLPTLYLILSFFQVCIYNKALQLSVGTTITSKKTEEAEKLEEDEGADEAVSHNIDLGNIMNLAAEDTLNIREFIWNVHYMWALPLKITVIVGLVYMRLGISAALGAILGAFIIIPLQFLVGKLMSDNNKKILETEDKRLQLSAEALQCMKTVKLNCWEDFVRGRIEEERNRELKCLRKDSIFWSVMAFFASISTLFVTTITVGIFIGIEDHTFTAANLFTAMALFNQLTVCLSVFPVTIPIFIKGFVSRNRIIQFFNRPETYDTFVPLDKHVDFNDEEALDQDIEDDVSLNSPMLTENNAAAKLIIELKGASFRWTENSVDILHDINLTIPQGKLTILIGKSGSGKSSLLAAILKELHQTKGTRDYDTEEEYSKYALLPQNPWLLNATIKDNILFGRPFKAKRYMKTIQACELKAEIDMMPDGHETEVGERGILLSGGQRQRLALARCLYSTAPIVLLDSPFSALDNKISKLVFVNAIQNILVKKRRTVVITTGEALNLKLAHHIIVLENGTAKAQGDYKEIIERVPDILELGPSSLHKADNTARTATKRWTLLKNVVKCGIMKNTHQKSKSMLKHKESVQDVLYSKIKSGSTKRRLFRKNALGSSSQLIIHHAILLPSDENQDESMQASSGLLSNRHKQILLERLTKTNSTASQCLGGKIKDAENMRSLNFEMQPGVLR